MGLRITSRLSRELSEIRWTNVLVELALVVLGILIALAVGDFGQARHDAESERQYLARLGRDLDQDLTVLQEFTQFEERQQADGILAYRALRGGTPVADKEAVALALTHLLTRRTVRLSRATYDDLLSTGNVRLVHDTALRDRLTKLYESNDRLLAIIDRNNEIYVDRLYVPFILDSGLIAPRPSSNLPTNDAVQKDFAKRLGLSVDARDDPLWKLPADAPERAVLLNKLWVRTMVSAQASALAGRVVDEHRAVSAAITKELSRR
jgi:hypothetical protein